MSYSVYFLFSRNKLIYIGMTCNVPKRLADHGVDKFDRFRSIDCGDKKRAFYYEQRLIRYFKPIMNATSKEAKETASFKIRKELRNALIKEAEKQDRTLSWLLEKFVETQAKREKIKVV
jgi:predicted GIY-YIG superfamily endonuclease